MADNSRILDPKNIFTQGLGFEETYEMLRAEYERRIRTTEGPIFAPVPCEIVVAAFAAELYLKCLYVIEQRGRGIRGHNLLELFRKLSPELQERINDLHTEACSLSTLAMYEHTTTEDSEKMYVVRLLNQVQDAFDEWRYAFEGLNPLSVEHLYPLLRALRRAILEYSLDCYTLFDSLKGVSPLICR